MVIAFIRTVIFYFFSIPFTLIWASICGLVCFLIPYPARYFVVIGGWARVMHVLTVVILGIRVRVQGQENIPSEACVIVSNHQSAWETYYLQLVFAPQSQVAKASLLNIPFFGWTFRMMKPIAINRSNKRKAMAEVIDKGTARIQEGNSVLVFPEGTRSKPSEPLPFRKGAAVLAKSAGCTMVPVTHNSGRFWLNDRFIKQAGVVDLVIHPALSTEQLTADELMRQAEKVIVGKLREIEATYEKDETKNTNALAS